MKPIILVLFTLLTFGVINSQTTDYISYQAVVRDSESKLVSNKEVAIQVTILQSAADGTPVYQELHKVETNENGLLSIQIGGGQTSDSFQAIDWTITPSFLKTEIDPNGGNDFTIVGVSQLLSVPYALHAKSAETITGNLNETDPLYNSSIAASITAEDTALWNTKPTRDTLIAVYYNVDTVFQMTSRVDSIYSVGYAQDSMFIQKLWNDSMYSTLANIDTVLMTMGVADTFLSRYIIADYMYNTVLENDTITTGLILSDSAVSQYAAIGNLINDTITSNFIQSDSVYAKLYQGDVMISDCTVTNTIVADTIIGNYAEKDGDNTNEIQRLSVSQTGDTLFLSKSNWIIIPGISEANKKSDESSVKDIDGNIYKTVQIGDQIWMAENLKVSRYPNGKTIPYVLYTEDWASNENTDTADAYCYYIHSDSLNYGGLYTYAAAIAKNWQNDNYSNQGVCPDGWHLPSEEDWTELENYLSLNGYNFDGTISEGSDKIGKSLASTEGWIHNNTTEGSLSYLNEKNNSSGFSALAVGMRYGSNGAFSGEHFKGLWWTSLSVSEDEARYRGLFANRTDLLIQKSDKSSGLSIRCVMD